MKQIAIAIMLLLSLSACSSRSNNAEDHHSHDGHNHHPGDGHQHSDVQFADTSQDSFTVKEDTLKLESGKQ